MGIPKKPTPGKDSYGKDPGSAGGGDAFGYKRGARGIDDDKDDGFDRKNVSDAMIEATYGRCWGESAGTSKKGLGNPWGGSK